MRKAGFAVAVAVAAWSVQDIVVWRYVFADGHRYWEHQSQYQYWHQAFLVLLIAGGVAWLRGPWGLWFAVATWTLANSGLADILYYWLDLKALPQQMPWLADDLHPLILSPNLVLSAGLWLALWLGSLMAVRFVRKR